MQRRRSILYLFILLIMIALAVISWDYACGHMAENPLAPNTCPLCAAFSALLWGLVCVVCLLLFRQVHCDAVVQVLVGYVPLAVTLDVFSLRAPPAAH